jgi:hypothetical protein
MDGEDDKTKLWGTASVRYDHYGFELVVLIIVENIDI